MILLVPYNFHLRRTYLSSNDIYTSLFFIFQIFFPEKLVCHVLFQQENKLLGNFDFFNGAIILNN
jgi:hypothetical protein